MCLSSWRLLAAVATLILLCACTTAPPSPAPVTKPQPQPASAPVVSPQQTWINGLLASAEEAMAANKLLLPEHDNAFDRFQAVLLLDANNALALRGLAKISQRYEGLAKSAARKANWSQASLMLRRASQVDGKRRTLTMYKKRWGLTRLPKAPVKVRKNVLEEAADGIWRLSKTHLNQRNQTMQEQLQAIGAKVKSTQVAFLITCRSDEEGRWIYSQMRKGAPGYRLRGNIKIGKQPTIQLLQSLSQP